MSLCTKLLPIIALVLIGSFTSALAEASCSAGDCTLVWEDNFDGTAVDPLKWEFENGNGCQYGQNLCGWGNNELQYYRAGNTVVANGELTITAKQENYGGANYTSSKLRTKGLAEWTYGRFEMRAKLPTGQGIWPAFWMLPTNSPYGSWARSGEIDIMEITGDQPDKIVGTIHYHDNWPDNWSNGHNRTLTPPGTAHNDFHVYAVEWEADEIRWYVDGNLYHTVTWWDSVGNPFPAPFDVDFHLILNLAVGGNWPGDPDGSTVFPQEYVIDYVRVYQPGEPPPVFDDMEHGNPYGNGWFEFFGAGQGYITSNANDLPPVDGGSYSMETGWGLASEPGYLGGFGRNNPMEITGDLTDFQMWINPDASQDYTLAINLQEDDNGDGTEDEEFQFDCTISPTGPCAIAGGGWQLVSIPLDSFVDDNSFLDGGNGILDAVSPANGGNGELINIVVAVTNNSTAEVILRTDYWVFETVLPDTDSDGVDDSIDNCIDIANTGQQDTDSDGHGNICDADIDQNCFTNFNDMTWMKSFFFSSNANLDLDSSGFVNFDDLTIMKTMFFKAPGPSAAGDCN